MSYMVESFFIWVVIWIWWFPRVRCIWIVIDNVSDEWELMKVENKLRMAAWTAMEWVKCRNKELENSSGGMGKDWKIPDVEIVTWAAFERFWWQEWGGNTLTRRSVLEGGNYMHQTHVAKTVECRYIAWQVEPRDCACGEQMKFRRTKYQEKRVCSNSQQSCRVYSSWRN